jgi:DNA-binding NarL/FixJ family response regulator
LTDPVRVIVADDHPIVRDGLATLLGSRSEVDLLGLVGDGEQA